ncbi:MAG: hypothetical protein K2N27_04975 [Ruminococcus sp.]|nr:hypothetical protein [Ruminococcus sp.]
MAQNDYFDITKVSGVTPEIIKAYKKLVRRERYLEEIDRQHIACHFSKDEEIYSVFSITSASEHNPETEKKVQMLYKALEMLRTADETNYNTLIDYYFACDKISYSILAKKYNVSKQTVYNRIQRAIIFLRGAMIKLSDKIDK